MKTTFTLEEIERAIRQSPRHTVHIDKIPAIDDNFPHDITTIEIEMFLFRLFGSNKEDYDEYKESKK